MKRIKPIAAFAVILLAGIRPAAAETPVHPNPYAVKYGYPYTRTFNEGKDRNRFAETGNAGLAYSRDGSVENKRVRELKRDDAVERYHDDVWYDKYRWLEDIDEIRPEYAKETSEDRRRINIGTRWENPDNKRVLKYLQTVQNEETEVNKWVEAQNAATDRYIKNIPYYGKLKQRIDSLFDYEYTDFESKKDVGDFKFARQPDGYYRLFRKDKNGKETVVVNERDLSADGSMKIVDRFLNPKGNYFAAFVREGSADSDRYYLYVWDTLTGRLAARIDRIVRGSESLAWEDDNTFYYIQNSGAYGWMHVMKHRMDKKELNDSIVIHGRNLDGMPSEIWLEDDNRYLVVENYYSTLNSLLNYKDLKTGRLIRLHNLAKLNRAKRWDAFTGYKAAKYVYQKDGQVYFITTENSEWGEIVKTDLKHPSKREVIVPAVKGKLLDEAVYQNGHFLLKYKYGGTQQAVLADKNGKILKDLTPAQGGVISDLYSYETETGGSDKHEEGTRDDSDRNYFSFRYEDLVTPRTVYKYSLEEDKIFSVKRRDGILFDSAKYETRYTFYTSKDGTRVPIVIGHKKGLKLDGSNPTILYGYGGFGASENAYFNASNAVWLEHGGVYAIAFLRGGSEYGEAWHLAGKQLNKMNVFDDLAAAADFLKKEGYTSKRYLGLAGASNGGLLVAASMTLHPEMAQVAIPQVGVLDMLRHDKSYRYDGWINEYGMAEDSKAMYEKLKSYSPYHNVKDGVCYPATLVMTSKRDDRVTPSHSYKFAALLQEKQACDRPMFLHTAQKHGHSPNTRAEQKTNFLYSTLFYLHEMGIKELPPIVPRLTHVDTGM